MVKSLLSLRRDCELRDIEISTKSQRRQKEQGSEKGGKRDSQKNHKKPERGQTKEALVGESRSNLKKKTGVSLTKRTRCGKKTLAQDLVWVGGKRFARKREGQSRDYATA